MSSDDGASHPDLLDATCSRMRWTWSRLPNNANVGRRDAVAVRAGCIAGSTLMGWSGYAQPPNWQRTRARIIRRDPTCRLGYPVCTGKSTTADHRVPVSQGGGHDDDNLQGVCAPCHAIKTEAERRFGKARRNPKRKQRQHPSDLA